MRALDRESSGHNCSASETASTLPTAPTRFHGGPASRISRRGPLRSGLPVPATLRLPAEANFSGRAVPDVAHNAAVEGGVLVAYSALGPAAGFYIVGGTSAGSPQWAGILALANTARATRNKGPIGFANPALYSIAKSAEYSSDFHDIQVGNNILFGATAGFSAEPGFDLITGWGTPNVANLVAGLAAQQ